MSDAVVTLAPPLKLGRDTRLLVVAPHPDDETLGCGELLQATLSAGGEADVLLLTDGDNNPWPQRWLERRWNLGPAARTRWGARRRTEVAAALRQLGVSASRLHALGWSDLGLTRRLIEDFSATVAVLTARLQALAPNLVLLPDLADSHPDHGAAHVLLRLALERLGTQPRLFAYHIHGACRAVGAAALPAELARWNNKQRAVLQHTSQLVLSRSRMLAWARRPECYFGLTPRKSSETAAWPADWRPLALLQPWLRITAVDAQGAQSWRWRDAPWVKTAADGYRLAWPSVDRDPLSSRFLRLELAVETAWIFDHWGWRVV